MDNNNDITLLSVTKKQIFSFDKPQQYTFKTHLKAHMQLKLQLTRTISNRTEYTASFSLFRVMVAEGIKDFL